MPSYLLPHRTDEKWLTVKSKRLPKQERKYHGLALLSVACRFTCIKAAVSEDGRLMKRSFSTIGDQCVNGLWQEQHSLEKISPDGTFRARQRSYRGHFNLFPKIKRYVMFLMFCSEESDKKRTDLGKKKKKHQVIFFTSTIVFMFHKLLTQNWKFMHVKYSI